MSMGKRRPTSVCCVTGCKLAGNLQDFAAGVVRNAHRTGDYLTATSTSSHFCSPFMPSRHRNRNVRSHPRVIGLPSRLPSMPSCSHDGPMGTSYQQPQPIPGILDIVEHRFIVTVWRVYASDIQDRWLEALSIIIQQRT